MFCQAEIPAHLDILCSVTIDAGSGVWKKVVAFVGIKLRIESETKQKLISRKLNTRMSTANGYRLNGNSPVGVIPTICKLYLNIFLF